MRTFYVTEIGNGKIFNSYSECRKFIRSLYLDDRNHYSESYIIKFSGDNIKNAMPTALYSVFHHSTEYNSEMRITRPYKVESVDELKNYKYRWSSPYQLFKYLQMDENERHFFVSSVK